MLTIRAMSNGAGYAARHLEHADYYAEGERVVGQWYGRGAAELGLAGEVRQEQFEAIRQGLHPETGASLRPRQSADRIAEDGSTQSRGRHLYDFTESAPKSVSILAVVGGDERLIAAHARAAQEALAELEAHAAARVRVDGANENRTTGNLVLAVYHHDTSRELDPQLHMHAVAGNLTYDGTEGRWKALQASAIYERRAYLTEVYRNALAREVQQPGYQIQHRRDARGRDAGFEIVGVSDELSQKFSQRSQQRDEAIEAFTAKHGRRPTDNEVAVLVRDSRPDKLTSISTEEVRRRQRARLSVEEAETLGRLRKEALDISEAVGTPALESAAPSVQYAQDHLFERVSVARDYELLTEALRHGRGRIRLEDAKGVLTLEESAGRMLRVGHDVTTRESLDRERQMVAAINHGLGRHERLGGDRPFVVSDRLRPEQRHAVEGVLDSRDWAINLRGAAGTGKTATLQELRRGLVEGGREVLAVAPTMSAVEELHKVGFTTATTVQRLLQDPAQQERLPGAVVIADEAGMFSARQMAELVTLAQRLGTRVIFSGDTQQIPSVEAGDALRILERESRLTSVALTEVQRQTDRDYREAMQELRWDAARGFDRLDRMGAIREVAWADRAQVAAELWREARGRLNARGEPSSVLVVCPTHEEIGRVTAAIRAERQRLGELGVSVRRERLVPVNYTVAQKGDVRHFREGQVLVFHRSIKSVEKDAALTVQRVEADRVIARTDTGAERVVTRKHAKAFDVYETRPMDIAPHDRLLLTANRRMPGFRVTNGEVVTVSRVDERGGLVLHDGRILPAAYKHLDYGYAVTAHRSQGRSVDAVVISGEAMNRELFYVAASRGRERVTVVTSHKGTLRESVGQSSERQSASELVRKLGDHGRVVREPRGVDRGVGAARNLADQAARQAPDDVGPGPVPQQTVEQEPPTRDQQPRRQHVEERGYGLRI